MTLTRREFLARTSLAGLAALLPKPLLRAALAAEGPLRFFSPHEAAVVEAAAARLIPGPRDDPLEAGHPGAREAGVVRYVDLFLTAFDETPPRIFAGGPWSDRAGGDVNHMATFLPLSPRQEAVWRARVADLQGRYRAGVASLDERAGGDFTALPPEAQDLVLAQEEPGGFRDLLFGHAIEGMFAVPEYGGNRDLVGWREIRFPGDSQPRGYTDDELSRAEGLDPVDPTGVVAALLEHVEEAAGLVVRGIWGARLRA